MIRLWHHSCPACQKAPLYCGLLSIYPHCPECDFPLAAHDSADGPAFIIMTVLNFLIMGLAVWLEFTFEPPIWVHAVLWLPLIGLLTLLGLRISKAWMIRQQYTLMRDSFTEKS